MSNDVTRLGWAIEKRDWSIKAGSSALVRVVAEVTLFDGSPLPDYTGWTAKLELYPPESDAVEITKEPTVTGDDGAMTLTIDLQFDPEDTEDLAPDSPVTLHGSIWFSHPLNPEQYSPVRILLKVEPHD